MGGGRKGKKSKKTKTKAQKMAVANKAKYGGTASAAAANRNRNKTSGIGPVASGKDYAKALSTATNQPTKRTSGIGPYADGKKYAEALKKSPPRFSSGTMEQQKAAVRDGTLLAGAGYSIEDKKNVINYHKKLQADPTYQMKDFERDSIMRQYGRQVYNPADGTLTATHDNRLFKSVPATGPAGDTPASDAYKDGMLQRNLTPSSPGNIFGLKLASTGDLTGLGIGSTPNYFSVKSPDTYGAPSQEAVDKAAGITAGGLNVGGSGFTPTNFNDPTARVADAYKKTLNPDSFKGLSDGETFGSGPVASGEDYARGLNVDHNNVENIMRRFVEKRLPIIDALPGVNTRRLTDKEIADKRVKAQKMRKEMMLGRSGSGGNKLPVTPTVIEEILPEALPVPSGSTTPTTQTGVDPNRLLQIQQQAYAQAYNPMLIGGFNPQFRLGAATPTIDYSTYFNY